MKQKTGATSEKGTETWQVMSSSWNIVVLLSVTWGVQCKKKKKIQQEPGGCPNVPDLLLTSAFQLGPMRELQEKKHCTTTVKYSVLLPSASLSIHLNGKCWKHGFRSLKAGKCSSWGSAMLRQSTQHSRLAQRAEGNPAALCRLGME